MAEPADAGSTLEDLVARGAALLDGGAASRAFEAYGEALGALHGRYLTPALGPGAPQPGPHDQPILNGLQRALGALIEAGEELPRTVLLTAVACLESIASIAGLQAPRYRSANDVLVATWRSVTGSREG